MRRPRRLIVVGNMHGHAGHGLLAGVMEYCRKHGQWQFQLEPNAADLSAVARVKQSLAQWEPDGILADVVDTRLNELIVQSGLPVVNIPDRPRDVGTPIVEADQLAIGRMVAKYYLDKGFTRFAYCGTSNGVHLTERRDGFCQTVRGAGFTCSVLEDFVSTRTRGRVRRVIAEWVAALPKPVAVMCCHDYRGRDLIESCREAGLTVPDEVSVVAVENDEIFCVMSDPPMSSVEIPSKRIGYEAAALVHKMINGRRALDNHILLSPVEIVVRASSETIAISDPGIIQALQFIQDRAGEPISVKNVLKEVAMSRRSFERKFSHMTGCTPKKQIVAAHIAQAKRLLVNTDLAIPDVAARSGFAGPEVFFRVFRRLVGSTPRVYRQGFRVN